MKVAVDGQSSGAQETNTSVYQGTLFGPNFSAFYYDMPGDILKSLVNIYANGSTLYGGTSKNHDERRINTDHYSNRSLTAQ